MPIIDWSKTSSGYVLPAIIESGARNTEMHRYLSSLRGKGATDEQLEAAAAEANAQHFSPPISDSELRSIVRSVSRYDVGDGTYHGPETPKVVTPGMGSLLKPREIDLSVLPDISHMTPTEQANAFVRACFEEEDTICLSRNLMDSDDETYEYAGVLTGGAGYDGVGRYLPYVEEVGMWCCVNPLLPDNYHRDKTCIAAYRNMLVECDTLPLDQQLQLMLDLFWGKKALRAITYSGGKSYHCVLRVGARTEPDYRATVAWVYDSCDAHGLTVDRQCGNPTRMTRFPGAMRMNKGKMQRLVWAYGC